MVSHGCPVAVQAQNNPENKAVICGDQCWTYASLDQRVETLAAGLVSLGLKPGQVLLMVSGNTPELLLLILACLRAGIVACPVNPRFTQVQTDDVIARVGVDALWSPDALAAPAFTGVRLPSSLLLLESSAVTMAHLPAWDDRRICNLVLTSGSSGTPKAAAHSFSCHRASASASAEQIPLTTDSRWLMSLPLFHIGGLATVFRCFLAGSAVVFPEPQSALPETLKRTGVTHLSMVNTQLYRLLQQPGFDFQDTQVSVVLMGGGYVASELAQQAVQQGVRLLTTYGMTEMSSQICTGAPVFLDGGWLTSGQPLSSGKVRITSGGNIQVRGPALFCGYWEQGRVRLPDSDGWFETGDRGEWFYQKGSDRPDILITGRSDNRFVCAGENIQPEAIEKALLTLNGVSRALVTPVLDDEYGHRPVALVECDAARWQPDIWRAELRKLLSGIMVPEYFLKWPVENDDGRLKVNRRKMTDWVQAKLLTH